MTHINIDVDEYGICNEGVRNRVLAEAGLKIVITDKFSEYCVPEWAINAKIKIYDCLDERKTITVPACDLADAIERIVYSLSEKEFEIEFFRLQIGKLLAEVHDQWTGEGYKVTEEIRQLIQENKLYRISNCVHRLLKARGTKNDIQK